MFPVKHLYELIRIFRQNGFYFAPKYKHQSRQFKNDCAEIKPFYTYAVCIKQPKKAHFYVCYTHIVCIKK